MKMLRNVELALGKQSQARRQCSLIKKFLYSLGRKGMFLAGARETAPEASAVPDGCFGR